MAQVPGRPEPSAAAPPAPADPYAHFLERAREVLRRDPGAIVRVAQLGDSHTASDALTGELRSRMQARLGDAGHGFVVPGWPASRLHRGVRLEATAGWTVDRVKYVPRLDVGDRMFGIGAASVRSAAQGEAFSVFAQASSFDLFYLACPGGGSFDVQIDGASSERISTQGPEPEPRFHRMDFPDGPHRLDLHVVGDGEVRVFGVQIERPGPGAVYSSLGVLGARVSTPLEWEEQVFSKQLQRMKPDLVVLMYGTNDLYADDFTVEGFAHDLERLIERVHQAVPVTSCLVLAPPDVARRGPAGTLASVPALVDLVAAERRVTEASGCAFWDTLAEMGGPGAILDWNRRRPPLAARDHVHLTPAGYTRLADSLGLGLLSRLSESL